MPTDARAIADPCVDPDADSAASRDNDRESGREACAQGNQESNLTDLVTPGSQATEPVRTGATALVVLAGLVCLYMLHWAAALFVPLLMGLMVSYALTPVVNRMVRSRLPRSVCAALLLSAIVSAIGSTVYTLSDDAAGMINALPGAAQKLRRSLEEQRDRGANGAIEKMQRAATEIERAADERAAAPPARGVVKVQVEKPRFNVKDYLWPGALGLAAALGQAAVIFFVAFFLLASGNTFRRKMVRIAGPTLGHKKLTVLALDEVSEQIQRYLLVQLFTSALVGVATWLAFLGLGVDNAAVWGVATFLLNFIPYLGSSIVTAGSALLGFVQFGSFEMAALIGGVALLINSIEGYLLTPWLTGKASRMNPVAIFVGVIAWGWLWGVWGLFLGVPMLLAMKAVCDRVDGLKPIGELLGE